MMALDELAPMDRAARLARLRDALGGEECDALLVTNLVNVRYLTGFTGSAAMVLVRSDDIVFVTDGRYEEQAAAQLGEAGVEATVEIGNTAKAEREALTVAADGIERLGLEADHVTWAQKRAFAGEWFADAELVATDGVVAELRKRKDTGEVARIEAAAAIATSALDRLRGRLLERPSEAEFGLELDNEMRRLGAAGPSFETIVASGPNGAMPHAQPGPRRIEEGDLVVLDFGAVVDGYCSDMTRTLMIGDPSPTQARMLEVVAAAQQAGVNAVAAGATCVDVDRAARAVIEEAGWGEAFVHATGHGVGLDIHEDPRVSYSTDPEVTLGAGYVVTVEPGVYLPGHGGVRIEDTVVVTAEGCRPLTHATKDPTWPSRPTT